MTNQVSYARLPDMAQAGLEKCLTINKGANIDRRSYTAGFYAAAALMAAQEDRPPFVVDILLDRSNDAVNRKGE